ncbi:MAG: hypothetical protein CVV31_04025 [Methanomicrobiales archaeon HGW-Methanomicrobiales-2]|nr:MAG: hypothetical protein CVV31_04025 [Methanomicrobiales archaeon HGW-Methanomicrobiales-2]
MPPDARVPAIYSRMNAASSSVSRFSAIAHRTDASARLRFDGLERPGCPGWHCERFFHENEVGNGWFNDLIKSELK